MHFMYRVIILPTVLITLTSATLRLTNIKCEEFDKPFATFEKCQLKLLQRGIVGLNIHVKLLQLPVNNVTINLALLKKANGYRPFLYNVSADFCKFMKSRRKLSFLRIFFDILLKDSNINHSCPYNNDIIVSNLVLKESMFRLLPLPTGEYMFQLKVGAYNDWKANVKAYFTLIE